MTKESTMSSSYPKALLCALLTLACAGPTYVAKVNGELITAADVRAEFKRRHGGHEKFLGGVREARQFLEKTIDRRLLLEETYRLGFQADPVIKKAEAELVAQEEVKHFLDVEIDKRTSVREADVRAVYDRYATQLLHVRQIVTATRADAEALLLRLRAGEAFAALAAEHSVAHSRLQGGELAPIGWGTMDPEWEAVVFPLAEKGVTGAFKSGPGWEVVLLEERKKVEPPPFAKAAARIRGILERRQKDARKSIVANQLWSRYAATLVRADVGSDAFSRDLVKREPATVASWRGGALTFAQAATNLDLPALAKLPAWRRQVEIADLVRAMVSAELARLEAQARGYRSLPEIQARVRAFREQQMENKLQTERVLKGVQISETDVRKYFDTHPDEMRAPERRQVAHILVPDEKTAALLRKRLEEGETFEALSKKHSQDKDTASKGGDLGWITRDDVPPEFAAVLSLKAGETSKPIKSLLGFHLVRLGAIQPPRPLRFDEAADRVRRKLLRRAQDERVSHWVKQLREAAEIEIDERGLRELSKSVR